MLSMMERFDGNYVPEPNSGCWLWLGALSRGGYGSITRKGTKAYCASWRLYKGEIPHGLCVCHHCDNPSCVNPDHLFLGTIADNNADRGRKKRGKKIGNQGTKHPYSKLTDEQILEIRISAEPLKVLANRYGVVESCICKIRRGYAWRHLGV
jgi:hypothetical protein